jgi:hypothetical protein
MGHSSWNDAAHHARSSLLRASGTDAFAHNARLLQMAPEERRIHTDVNPLGVRFRESRDSVEHPTSLAIAVLLDVTGSMRDVPRTVQQSLSTLFGTLLRGVDGQPLVAHPQILIGAIGDANCDSAPLQIGQFESGNEVDDDLSKLWLEGCGGGQNCESYELAMYFMARHTAIDCHERRRHPGYLFICGDEHAYPRVNPAQVRNVIGDDISEPIDTTAIVRELQQKYTTYFVKLGGTSYFDSSALQAHWAGLLGEERVLSLRNPQAISATIATTVCVAEATVDYDALLNTIPADMRDSVATAVGPVGRHRRVTGIPQTDAEAA